jgi:hypothetical protein
MKRPVAWAGVAMILAGSSCAGDTRGEAALGEAAAAAAITDWKIFNTADTNGDGLADLLWWSASANALSVWLMDGTRVLAPGGIIPGPPGAGWVPPTTADFNRDGLIDVVWTNADRGTMLVWLLADTHLLAAGPEIHGPPGEGWAVANAGDTNGDGMADVVWYNAARNRFAVWLMDGARLLAPGPEYPGPPGEGWAIANVSDMNGDGMGDIIWGNATTDRMAIWLLADSHVLARGPEIPGPPGEGWSALTAADFNRDGFADVIWTNDSHSRAAVWLMRGARLLAPGPVIPGPQGDGWTVAYAADANGDGMADVTWQKTGTSLFAVWLMNGARVLMPGPVLPGPIEAAGVRR